MELPVEKILKNKKISYRIIPLSGVAITHRDVIKYAHGANPDDDCKTILVKDSKGKTYALFLPGTMKVSFNALKQILASKVDILSVQELKQVTGKDRGAVCPILLEKISILVDKRIF